MKLSFEAVSLACSKYTRRMRAGTRARFHRHPIAREASLVGRIVLPCCLVVSGSAEPVMAAAPKVKAPTMPAAYEGIASSATDVTSPAIDEWWHAFQDPELDALQAEALKIAPDARVAAERLIEARQTRRREKTATGPGGSISGTISHRREYDLSGGSNTGGTLSVIDGTTDVLSTTANFSYELDLLGRQAALRRAAAATEIVERFGAQAALIELTSQIASEYFQCQGLVARLAVSTEQVRFATDRVVIARRKAAVGLGFPQEVWRLAGLQEAAQADVERLSAQVQTQKRQILILIGRGTDPESKLAISPRLSPLPEPVNALPSELLTRRPDVRQAEFRFKAALGRARYRHLSVFPSISFLPSLGLSRTPFPSVSLSGTGSDFSVFQQNKTQGFWLLGLGVTIPTLDIPRLLAEARAEDSRARQAAINYEKAAQVAYGDAEKAMVTLAAGRRTEGRLLQAQAEAKTVYDAVRRRHAAGLDDEAAWVDAQENWLRVQQNLTNEQVENLRRQTQLYKALGGGWNYSGQPS